MELLSKFVRGRLTLRQEKTGDHPDANLLVAFAEQKLPARDRGVVLAHLARCSDCRDVVALASAVDRSVNQLDTLASRRTVGWWTWRWAGIAAVACLTTIVVLRPDWNKKHAPAPELRKVLVAEEQNAAEPGQSVEFPKPSPPTRRSGKQAQARALAAPPPGPAPIQQATSIDQGLPLSASDAKEEPRGLVSPSLDQLTTMNSANRLLPTAPQAQSFVSGTATQTRFRRMASPLVSKPLADAAIKSIWKLGAPGTLQRSEDGGATWHTVSVREEVEFYALSATGANLWVGGAGGALFHSMDDGLHWVNIAVTDGETHLTDAITRIDLHEDQSVDLRTGS